MNQEEVERLIAARRWTVRRRAGLSRNDYIYAAKSFKGKTREVYIAPVHRLENLTAEIIENKLKKGEAKIA